jgi:hypothetical protein
VGCCYAAGAFSFQSVLGLFLGNDNNGVVFSLGSVPRVYFFACLLACTPFLSFEPPIQRVPGVMRSGRESMAGETLSRPTIEGFRNFVRVRWLPRIRI